MAERYRIWIGIVDINYFEECEDVNYGNLETETFLDAYWYDIEPKMRLNTKEEYMEMPKDVTCNWIETENDVQRLSVLLNEEFIGVDSEWRPQLTQFHKTAPSLF